MQRLHVDDPSGILIEQGWPRLVIPAIAVEPADYRVSEDEVYHRPAGQLLQRGRDDPEAIEELKREIGSRVFAAQYQQNPTPPDGNMIKAAWLGRYDTAPERKTFRRVVLSCDPAGKAGIHNDYTAITVVGVREKSLLVLQVSRGHWTVMQMREQIVVLAAQWQVDLVIVEDTSSGMGLIQLLKEAPRLDVVGRKPDTDKETRMSRQQGRFEAGRILLPTEALWLADFENELLAFPGGRYNDQVDALLLFSSGLPRTNSTSSPSSFAHPSSFGRPTLGHGHSPRGLRTGRGGVLSCVVAFGAPGRLAGPPSETAKFGRHQPARVVGFPFEPTASRATGGAELCPPPDPLLGANSLLCSKKFPVW